MHLNFINAFRKRYQQSSKFFSSALKIIRICNSLSTQIFSVTPYHFQVVQSKSDKTEKGEIIRATEWFRVGVMIQH